MAVVCTRLSNNHEKKYDKTFRGNLKNPGKSLIKFLLGADVENVIPLPPITRQTIVERETDMLVKISIEGKEPFILHLEFQSRNDPKMVERMAVYDYMLYEEYRLDVISIVLYAGRGKMNMKNSISFNGNYYEYQLIDIRDIPKDLFLESENPRETIFAILAEHNNKDRISIINKILNKLQLLCDSRIELLERIKELKILSNLRSKNLEKLITKEIQKMPITITYDIRKDSWFKQGMAEGKTEATNERNHTFVCSLLQNTSFSIERIASLVNMPVSFVTEIKKTFNKKQD